MSEIVLHVGRQGGMYYVWDGYKYAAQFPIKWAKNHLTVGELPMSGPKECLNCRSFGSIKGVFVAYCSNCVSYIYKDIAPERVNSSYVADEFKHNEELWQAIPYLRGVDISTIGDRRENLEEVQCQNQVACEYDYCSPPNDDDELIMDEREEALQYHLEMKKRERNGYWRAR